MGLHPGSAETDRFSTIRAPTDQYDHRDLADLNMSQRLLLCLYGLGTNSGLKRAGAGDFRFAYDVRVRGYNFANSTSVRFCRLSFENTISPQLGEQASARDHVMTCVYDAG